MKLLITLLLLISTLYPSFKDIESVKKWIVENSDIKYHAPHIFNNYKQSQLLWYTPANISVKGNTITFSFNVDVYSDSLITVELPGDATNWPFSVKVNSKEQPIIRNSNSPVILLKRGTYKISGLFNLKKLPNQLTVPSGIGIIRLRVDGKNIDYPMFENGKVQLKKNTTFRGSSQNNLTARLYRRVNDGVPTTVTTVVKLTVTGKAREVNLGVVTVDSTELISLKSIIPAMINGNGELKVQVKPGIWIITFDSRYLYDPQVFGYRQNKNSIKVENEIWSFSQDRSFRSFNFSGAAQVDPKQVQIPTSWRNLPTFVLNSGDSLVLHKIENYQRKSEDKLTLNRDMFLDFSGKGYTVLDKISGTIANDGSLFMIPPYMIGSIKNNGRDELIITVDSSNGINLKEGKVNLTVSSRVGNVKGAIPIVGYNKNVGSESITLLLPPGWDLFHAKGIDIVSGSRVSKWTLWDLFLVLLVTVLIYKIGGVKWSVGSFFMFILLYHFKGMPKLLLLNIAISVLILVNLGIGKFRNFVKNYSILSLILIAVSLIPFSVQLIRSVIYPSLDSSNGSYRYSYVQGKKSGVDDVLGSIRRGGGSNLKIREQRSSSIHKEVDKLDGAPSTRPIQRATNSYDKDIRSISRNEKVQTGPGIPTWSWNSYQLVWDGTVLQSGRFKLFLISPFMNAMGKVLGLILLIALFIKLSLIVNNTESCKDEKKGVPLTPSSIVLLLILCIPSLSSAQSYPPQYLFNKLNKSVTDSLNRVPSFYPHSAEVRNGEITAQDNRVTLSMWISSYDTVAFPIIVRGQKNLPISIKVNGKESGTINSFNTNAINQTLPCYTALLNKGINKVEVNWVVDDNSLEIDFATKVHNIKVATKKWSYEGIENGSVQGNKVVLTKRVISKSKNELIQPTFKPFFKIKRNFYFGYRQTVTTTIQRVTPLSVPVTVTFPKITGETFISTNVTVDSDSISVSFPANVNRITLNSQLPMVNTLTLLAPNSYNYSEEWHIDYDSRFKVTTKGVNSLLGRNRSWKVTPKDTLFVSISKPEPMAGKSYTIKNVKVSIEDGRNRRDTKVELNVTSSLGGNIWAKLPKGISLKYLRLNGIEQAITEREDTLFMPINPGSNTIEFSYSQNRGISIVSKSDSILLSDSSTNIATTYKANRSRWILFLRGPLFGPSILVWSVIVTMFIVAVALSKYVKSDITLADWVILFIGIASIHYLSVVPFVLTVILLSRREQTRIDSTTKWWEFNILQVFLATIAILSLIILVFMIPTGLIGLPRMSIVGNGSSSYLFNWYQDRAGQLLPIVSVYSLPMWFYRVLRLVWSIWLSIKIISWIKWEWKAFSNGGVWLKNPNKKSDTKEVSSIKE